MVKINESVKFFLNLAKLQAVISRRLDSGLGGLGFNEFIILYHLSQAKDEKLRRIDLAEKVGLTASGVTRILLPMEKVGFVKSGENEQDARVRFVKLAAGGKTKLVEAIERIELFADETIPGDKVKKIKELSEIVVEIGKNSRY
jgi:DNA-binding MarR family transcriptional regulator